MILDRVCPEEPLPPPKIHQEVDARKDDFELFQPYVLPNGGLCGIGDMWTDVPRIDQNSIYVL